MDINRCKLVIVSLFMITICFCLLPLPTLASSRGITIKAKTSSGTVKEIQLYSGYHALVVGVSDYDLWPDLPYATKDAQDVAGALKKMGFTVETIFNPSSQTLTKALNNLTYKYGRDSDRAILFYYAGHGETEKLADGTKLGYIIPKDCPLLRNDPEGFVNNAISMKDIEAYSLRIRSKHVLMLFDSCFSGSLFSLVRAVPEDITEKSTLPVRQYITAGTEDEAVPDRSMFKRCLLLGLDGDADLTRDGYITGTELGLYLHDKVIQNTRRAQHPQYGKIRTPELARGDFIFRLASSGVVIEKPSPIPSKAYLSVESNVSGARVLIDGRYVGTTNLSNIEVSPDEHQIKVEKDGHESYTRKVRFEKGRTRDFYVILDLKASLKSRLYVETHPEDARIRILNIGPVFHQGLEFDAGSYHVEVSADGYETQKMWVSLTAGQDKTLDIHLKPKVSDPAGSLKIDTLDVNSKFMLNVKEGKLFVIMGRVKNKYSDVRRFISINGRLYTKGKILAQTETVFCGNVLSDIELTNMEKGEIKKRLSNRIGDNKSNMQIKPGGELPFMIVFSNLPDNLDEFSIEVAGSSYDTSDENFIAYATGVVYDKNTGLEWYAGPDKDTNWNDAKRWVESLSVAGGGWRMPTREEIKTLYKEGSGTSNMTHLLKTTGWWVWSSESRGSSSAWSFSFSRGYENWRYRDYSNNGRGFAVRSRPKVSRPEVIKRDGTFIAYDNGTVKDTKTGLLWASKDNGEAIDWKGAKRYCENYRGGGYKDWRMPTQDELAGLYDESESYQAGGVVDVHLTKLIELSACCPWASETRGSEAAGFSFNYGVRHLGHQSLSNGTRALPVRSGR